jgi:hypothetical protein
MRRAPDHCRPLRLLPAASLLMVAIAAPCLAGPSIQVKPDTIEIGTFFGGAQVEVSAEIPAGSDAVIEVVGKEIEEQLLRKGRHWDIWMNVGEIDIEGAPSLYLARSTSPDQTGSPAGDPPFGYDALEEKASFLGDVRGLKTTRIFTEFVKLKESERLYGIHPGTLQVSPGAGDRLQVQGTFTIPPKVWPGTYQVRLSVYRDGRLAESGSAPLVVRVVRLPAMLSTLARRHGALYGLLAVGVAVLFGYLTGLVFRGAKGGH